VDEIVRRAMAKEPSDRFATGAELARALDWCVTGESADARIGRTSTPAAASPAAPAAETAISRFLAVLPFDNMSPDPENEYFSDGMTEEIIAQLSKIRGLKVISRASVMKYKTARLTAREIGRELGVTHLIDGSVRRAGQRVRISAQLIDAAADLHLWAETYDRDITDIFAIQREVAQSIASRMDTRVTPGEQFRLAKKPTEDIDAYHHFLLGRHHYNKVTPVDFAKAMEHYRAAIDRDPSFGRAYACIAEAQLYLGFGYWGVRPHDTFPEAYRLATKALELDPTSAEAHGAAGMYQEFYEFDWDRGGASMHRAVELNPSAPMLRILWAMHLVGVGRFDEAMAERDIARQLDPAAMAIHGNASWIAYLTGRREQAIAEGRTLRLLEPLSAYGAFSHGLVCAASPEHVDEAVAAFRDAERLSDHATLYVVMLAYALARAGKHEEARAQLAEAHGRTNEFVWPMGLAFAYAHLGETETALDYLDRAYDERVGWMVLLAREPALEHLREHPRFRRLVRRIGPAHAATARA
jgi:TolB-like protein/Flp pilus assembly protein TadD